MKILTWLKKAAIGLILLIFFLSVIGAIYESILRAQTENQLDPVGKLIDVGGHQLHYVKQGTGTASVIFEAGLDPGGRSAWFRVQDKISDYATTLSYDRAGLMWSERGDNPKTAQAMAEELHALLEKTNTKPPYILVGHSFAGLILRSFIHQYPDEVSAIILVDASHPEQNKRAGQKMGRTPLWLVDYANSVGLFRLLPKHVYPNTNQDDAINRYANSLLFKSVRASIEETNAFESIAEEISSINSFGDIPLTVITANKEGDQLWNELQKELLDLSKNSQQITVSDSGHYIQLEKPNIVIDAIKEALEITKQ